MGKHHQQRRFLGQRLAQALIQLLVPTGVAKEAVKVRMQTLGLDRAWIVSVGQQIIVERPKVLGECLEEIEMGQEARYQCLVMAILMNPTQGQLVRQVVELGRIITEQ